MTSAAATQGQGPSSAFWDRHAEGYAKRPVDNPEGLEQKIGMIRQRLTPEMRVLELGCGTGTTALKLAPSVAEYRATDLSPKMIDICNRKLAERPTSGLSFKVSSVESFEAEEMRYDAVLCMSLLHLLKDRRTALTKIHQLLKPGGILFSNTACLKDLRTPLKYLIPIMRLVGMAPLVRSFSEAELLDDLQNTGFATEERFLADKKSALFLVSRRER